MRRYEIVIYTLIIVLMLSVLLTHTNLNKDDFWAVLIIVLILSIFLFHFWYRRIDAEKELKRYRVEEELKEYRITKAALEPYWAKAFKKYKKLAKKKKRKKKRK